LRGLSSSSLLKQTGYQKLMYISDLFTYSHRLYSYEADNLNKK